MAADVGRLDMTAQRTRLSPSLDWLYCTLVRTMVIQYDEALILDI